MAVEEQVEIFDLAAFADMDRAFIDQILGCHQHLVLAKEQLGHVMADHNPVLR